MPRRGFSAISCTARRAKWAWAQRAISHCKRRARRLLPRANAKRWEAIRCKSASASLRERRAEAARAITFKQSAEAYIAAHRAGWKNTKHAAPWDSTLATYTYPVMGSLPVAAIDVALVHKVLEPIWTAKPETASRLRGRIECILDWA